ncbi:MAG TPA: oxidoreductase membrane subunit [Syntrophomonas sp.]|nr:oxidoreductase membrane subunit [Syntrophomonas sp.]
MKKVTFKQQIYFGLAIVILGFVLSSIFKQGLFSNAGVIIYGLLFIINPVFPANCENVPRIRLYMRLAGFIVVVLGLMTRFGV